ncbi:MAG: hypothetical protein PHP01_09555, partial [Phycisphaerae bacterium]|nr:hypothetical protein [Phycisphaerae bacterium]
MNRNWHYKNMILTSAGPTAGIHLYDILNGQQEKILSFLPFESVYALDFYPQTQTLAMGSKAGFIYLVRAAENTKDGQGFSVRKIAQNVAILSVCFVDKDRLAATDTSGRCVIWQLSDQPTAQILSITRQPICNLFRPDKDKLAGISANGKVVIWDLLRNKTDRTFSSAPLAKPTALTKAVFWPVKNVWAWAARDGILVTYDFNQNKLKTSNVHQGNFYTVLRYQERLLTIGSDDGTAKLWQPDSNTPQKILQCPRAIISAVIWENNEPRLLAVTQNGKAGIYHFGKDSLEPVTHLDGNDFRVAAGSDLDALKSYLTKEKTLKAQAIALRIKEKARSYQQDGLNGLHKQLGNIGFKHVSLLLKAQAAIA